MSNRYVKKPVVIEAHQWLGQIDSTAPEWLMSAIDAGTVYFDEKGMHIMTLEGNHFANVGDYIIQGVHGELYPCKPDIFEETYEEVRDDE